MINHICRSSSLLSLLAVGAVFTLSLRAQDMVAVSPKLCTVRLDNEWVRVTEVRLKAGDKMPLHSHPPNLTYFFSAGKAKFTSGDGKMTESETTPNTARWAEAEKHAVEYIGPGAGHILVVEVKKPTGKKAPAGPDALKAAPDVYKLVLENESIRVLEVKAKAGTKIPMHAHPAYAAFHVTGTKGKFTHADGKSVDVETKAGDAVWSEPETHSVAIEADARVLVVELKK